MKITFEIQDRECLTLNDTNTALVGKLTALGHTLDPEITKIVLHPSTSAKLKQDAWKYIFRSIGVTKLETARDEANSCHRFVMHFPEAETVKP